MSMTEIEITLHKPLGDTVIKKLLGSYADKNYFPGTPWSAPPPKLSVEKGREIDFHAVDHTDGKQPTRLHIRADRLSMIVDEEQTLQDTKEILKRNKFGYEIGRYYGEPRKGFYKGTEPNKEKEERDRNLDTIFKRSMKIAAETIKGLEKKE